MWFTNSVKQILEKLNEVFPKRYEIPYSINYRLNKHKCLWTCYSSLFQFYDHRYMDIRVVILSLSQSDKKYMNSVEKDVCNSSHIRVVITVATTFWRQQDNYVRMLRKTSVKTHSEPVFLNLEKAWRTLGRAQWKSSKPIIIGSGGVENVLQGSFQGALQSLSR